MERPALIVARYREDVSWLASVPAGYDVFVYAKDPASSEGSYELLPNLGREAHTYLHFIITHYDSLPALSVFCQGDPFPHSRDFLGALSTLPDDAPFRELADERILFDRYGSPQLSNFFRSRAGMYLHHFYQALFGEECPLLLCARPAALFAVTRDYIRARPPAFYRRAMELITAFESPDTGASRAGEDIIEGHFFERLWHKIFAEDETLPLLGLPACSIDEIVARLVRWKELSSRRKFRLAYDELVGAGARLNRAPRKEPILYLNPNDL